MSVVMPLSNIVRKFAPRREQVVYNMVWVVHDAFEKCHQWILPDLIEWVFL